MAEKVRRARKGEAKLLLAIAAGATLRAAARKAGISERTAGRLIATGEFRQRVQEARDELITRATARLAGAATAAADTLRRLVKSDDERLRLQASRWILRLLTHLRDHHELLKRIESLETAVRSRRGR